MNRREFIRSAIATVTIMAVGVTGIYELAEKAASNSANQQATQLPPVTGATTEASSSQTASTSPGSTSSQATSQSASTQTTATSPSSTTSQATQSSSSVPAGYVIVASMSSLAGKTSAYFTHPVYGASLLLSMNGQWKAFSATCTHRPCTVEYASSEIYCPCHGATFSATNGSVTRGPAQVALEEFGVLEQNGEVYVTTSIIN